MNAGGGSASGNWLPLAIVGGLAALTFWLGHLSDGGPVAGDGAFSNEPDYFVDVFQATAFGTDGAPRYQLAAERMVHFVADDATKLIKPHFVRLDSSLSRVEVTAERGLVSSAGENVYFVGDVLLRQTTPGEQPPLELTAEYLRIIPDANVMRTEKPVTAIQGNSRVTAGAMEADGARRTLVMSGGVKGIYASRN